MGVWIADREADEVDIAKTASATWVAWSTAKLGAEVVRLAPVAEAERVRELAGTAFRPRLCARGDTLWLAACLRDGDASRPGGLVVTPQGDTPWRIDDAAACFGVALAPGDGFAHLAWEDRAAGSIVLARLDARGQISGQQKIAGRSPALAAAPDGGAYLAWVAQNGTGAGHIETARLYPDGTLSPALAIPGAAHQEGPAVCARKAGGWAVAWHSRARGDQSDVVAWLGCAVIATENAAPQHPQDPQDPQDISPAPRDVPDQQASGIDQGWELPAVAEDEDGKLWLAGRSSHSFWIAAHDGASWSARRCLSEPAWGGRGRRIALADTGGQLSAIYRDPDGITLTPIAAAPGAEAENLAPSNPPARPVRTLRKPYADVLFGDLHQHTAHSDGLGTAEELYLLARTSRALDFAAVTDHDRFCRRAVGPATWRYLCDVANAAHDPGSFVTFCAYELTGPRHPGFGHKCVYFADRIPERIPEKDLTAVFACLRELGGLAAPHHVAWTGMDAEHHDPVMQPVWEIFSVHGCYEHAEASRVYPPRSDCILPGHFVKDALEAGLRFGFIASTDSHGLLWHHGISPKRDPFSSGLAAIRDAEPTRQSILDAIRARRTYATTGAKIRLRVELDGAVMGQELPADAAGNLAIEAEGTAPIAETAIVTRAGDRVLDATGARIAAQVPVGRAAHLPWDYVYVRVTQADGEMAWSSPIWFG